MEHPGDKLHPLGWQGEVLLTDLQDVPEYEALVPRPSDEDYEALKGDLATNGQKERLKVDTYLRVLDGYTRKKILIELEKQKAAVEVADFGTYYETKRRIIQLARNRRHLTTYQKGKLANDLVALEEEENAQKRMRDTQFAGRKPGGEPLRKSSTSEKNDSGDTFSAGAKLPTPTESQNIATGGSFTSTPIEPATDKKGINPPEKEKGRALEKAASAMGTSRRTAQKVRKIEDLAKRNPKVKKAAEKAEKGQIPLDAAYKLAKKEEKKEEIRTTAKETPPVDPGKKPEIMIKFVIGDSQKILPDSTIIKPGRPQLVVTSPEYGIGKDYGEDEADNLDLPEWAKFIADLSKQVHKILPATGVFVLVVGTRPITEGNFKEWLPLAYIAYHNVKAAGFYFINEIIWHFKAGVIGGRRFNGRHETALVFVKHRGKYLFNLDDVKVPPATEDNRNPPDGVNPGDVWDFERTTNIEKDAKGLEHPCIFNPGFIERIILAFSNPGDLVVDPFVGSGSTLRAAYDLGRHAIGIDINPECETDVKIQMGNRPLEIITHKPAKAKLDSLIPTEAET